MKYSMKLTRALIAMGIAVTIPAAHAELELAPGLKAGGFLDMSATYRDEEGETTETASFDQWEIDLFFEPIEQVSARVDIDDQPSTDQEGAEVEQAFVTYDFENGLTAQAGKFLSALGYEGAEPTLLYQYSVSATIIGYPGYASGGGLTYDFGMGSIYGAVVDGWYSGDNDAEDLSYEVQLKLKPVEGLVVQAGYATEEFSETTEMVDEEEVAVDGYDKGIANFWTEYKVGALTLAAEYNLLYDIEGAGSDGDGYLVMGNYAFGKLALTLRHSYADLDNGYENTEYTISPSYKIASNLLFIVEYRHDDYGDTEADTGAAELLYTF
jgi:Putative beta-barrel porin-2, OmpL-like. bbp2